MEENSYDVLDLHFDESTMDNEFLDVNVDIEGPRLETSEIYSNINPRISNGDHSDNMDGPSHINNMEPNVNQVIWKHQLFVGNLTWWTTDQDIANACHDIGVDDVQDVKFITDPINGASKGCCFISVASGASMRLCMSLLPKKDLHGQKPMITPLTEEFLRFENQGPPQMPPIYQSQWNGPPNYQSQWNDPPTFSEQFVVGISEVEFEECMARIRRVSSSAIARAASDLVYGEYSSAIKTLVTAISLIKPSKVAQDERCKVVISTLEDVLREMQNFCSNRRINPRFGRERSRRRSTSVRSHSRSRCPRTCCERKLSSSRVYRKRSWQWERDRDRDGRRSRHYSDKSYCHARCRSRSRDSSESGRKSDDSYDHHNRRSTTARKTSDGTNKRRHLDGDDDSKASNSRK